VQFALDAEFLRFAGEPIQQRRQHVIRKMVEELRHRINPFLAQRASRHNDAFPALRHTRRLIDEMREVVAANLGLQGAK
jgi:DNA-binding transcriptional regulator YbjK